MRGEIHRLIVQTHIDHPDFPADAIAAHLGVPSATVRSVANRARLTLPPKRLKKAIWTARRLILEPRTFQRIPYAGKE